MGIKKQEFYEGAALHILARSGEAVRFRYAPPFFELNGEILLYLKYSTGIRSPWGFTFTADEQVLLHETASERAVLLGLICGSDGVAAINLEDLRSIAAPRKAAVRVSCYRSHGEHYEVNGPDGRLANKVPPSDWQRILRA